MHQTMQAEQSTAVGLTLSEHSSFQLTAEPVQKDRGLFTWLQRTLQSQRGKRY